MKSLRSIAVLPALFGIALFVLGGCAAAAPPDPPFDDARFFDDLCAKAKGLAAGPWADPAAANPLPDNFAKLKYDGYRKIMFRPNRAVWLNEALPFRLEFYHRGYIFNEPVEIALIQGGDLRQVPFSPDFFQYDGISPEGLTGSFGFAGFKVLYRLNSPEKYDEVISFLGDSYFRALGRGNVYGASARCLGVNVAAPDAQEEFPTFRSFWICRPEAAAKELLFYALLDCPSLAGAYRFLVTPGPDTDVEVTAALYARKPLRSLGISPLASMYLYGPPGGRRVRYAHDPRPQVHDSDGLLVHDVSGEWLWRPVFNPEQMLSSTFTQPAIGFGLLQRDRAHGDYLDTEAWYERRPNVWVAADDKAAAEPVLLRMFTSYREGDDNVTACWLAQALPAPGEERRLHYHVTFGNMTPGAHGGGVVTSTRYEPPGSSAGAIPRTLRFEVEFSSDQLEKLPPDAAVKAVVSATSGQVDNIKVAKDEPTGLWRLTFELRELDKPTCELRAFLRLDKDTLTETWSMLWAPSPQP